MYPVQLLAEVQVAQLTHQSLSYTGPYAQARRSRILLSAHYHPDWFNSSVSQQGGCSLDPV